LLSKIINFVGNKFRAPAGVLIANGKM